MRIRTVLAVVILIALGPMLAACENFDLDSLDVFGLSDKKKLPGDRKALFPEGVPGVTQGIPPELVKGSAAQNEVTAEAAKPPAEPKPEPKARKPKPRVTRAPATRVTVQPRGKQSQQSQKEKQEQQGQQSQPAQSNTPQQQQSGVNATWPSSNNNTQQQPSPWPSSPAPGTFQR